ncbi:hypothetical protein CXB51_011070 [Gossypium anomalum]|uniref:Protein kinase domain-containing protein n=1 Tax=Gossypium anomalum TaxID=47600 RepID=A0A8J6D3C6_9ROSI|nr:hypothetical protein CXB51_011070 [Gossypium anomalum]
MGGSRSYSANPSDYKLLEEVGYGASATVYRAIFLSTNDIIAVKCLDLDRCNSNLVCVFFLKISFISLTISVMPFMSEGSCLHLMKLAYPDGFEEPAIGSVLKETLTCLKVTIFA